jgi:hypothetical protein
MYNRFFADGGFGEKPSPIVEALPKFISSGNALDIGAGDGGNSLYLASQGFNVTANDEPPRLEDSGGTAHISAEGNARPRQRASIPDPAEHHT